MDWHGAVRRYRGEDRRATRGVDRRASGDLPIAPVAPVLGLTIGLLVGVLWLATPLLEGPDAEPLTAAGAVVSLVAVGLALSAWFHWRATGIAAGAWLLGAAVVVAAAEGVGLVPGTTAVVAAVGAVAAAHLVVAATTPAIDTAVQPVRVVGFGLVAAGAVGALSLLVEDAGGDIVVAMASVLWVVAGLLACTRGARGHGALLGWMGVAGIIIGVGQAMQLDVLVVRLPLLAELLLKGLGLGLMGLGTSFDLARAVVDQRDDRLESELHHRAATEHRRIAAEDRDHDLGNALTALEGATLTLVRRRDQLSEAEQEQLVGAIVRGASEVRRLTNGGPGTDEVAVANLREVVDHQATLVRANGGNVEIEGLQDAPVRAGPVDLQQVVQNLLQNAVRHGAGTDGAIVAELRHDRNDVVLSVQDHGPGVPAVQHEVIFERGVRLSTSGDGQGLGLAVARRVARRHGGDVVAVPSSVGACFELRLPAVAVPAVVSRSAEQ